MTRSLTLLALLACVAAPAYAADKPAAKDDSSVLMAQNTNTQPNRDNRGNRGNRGNRDNRGNRRDDRAAPPGAPAGARAMTTLSPYPLYERGMGRRFWQQGYVLTPLGYKRLRRAGFTSDEAYMIANAANATGLDPSYFEQSIYNGFYTRRIAYEYGIDPFELRRVRDEWKTQAWADAVGEPVLTRDRLNVLY